MVKGMSKKKSKQKRKQIRESLGNLTSNDLFYVNSPTKNPQGYFLGYKLRNHNGLWDWRTLEDVKF